MWWVVGLLLFRSIVLLFRFARSVKRVGSVLRHKVQFTWSNQEDNAEVCVSSRGFRELAVVLLLEISYM
jgi:hypothetical protein